MNRILKNLYVILSTAVLLLGAAFVAAKETAAAPYFQIQQDSGWQDISVFDAQDGNYYVFLPSYTELAQVRTAVSSGQEFCLENVRLTGGMTCRDFELETPYDFSLDGESVGTLWFYRSRNVPAMFVDTASGEMTQIHEDKSYEEYASMTLYAPDGSISYYDTASKVKGRGNSTWDREKRPYVLTLSADGDLLGMGSGKKWVLLANAYDETNLNNKLVFDLAAQVGMDWVPEGRFVDLYLNGVYSGLYLLTEKPEVSANRLDIETDSGEFLCKVELWTREAELERPFVSSLDRIVEVCAPESLSEQDLNRIAGLVAAMESELLQGGNLKNSQILDLDSWVRQYLIDEISGNIDADLTSSYFYFSGGEFFAGPIWDYDMAFGNNYRNQEPYAFLARNGWKTTRYSSPYYSALYENASFYRRMVEIYRTEFVPVLQDMLRSGIDERLEFIRAASQMNSIRWRSMYDEWNRKTEGTAIVCNPETLKSWFARRLTFLDSAWLEGKEYCTVQFAEAEGSCWTISTEKGTHLQTTYKDLADPDWTDCRTGLPVDLQSPITRDMMVMRKQSDTAPSEETAAEQAGPEEKEDFTPRGTVLFFAVLLSLFACLLLADKSRRQTAGKTKES